MDSHVRTSCSRMLLEITKITLEHYNRYINILHDDENIAYGCETQADTSKFTASRMCCACGGGVSWFAGSLPREEETRCVDRLSLDNCDSYDTSTCGSHDNVNFTSSEMCCVCGGGGPERFADTSTQHLNTEGLSCSDIYRIYRHELESVCTTEYDTNEFVASEMCLACGGGDLLCSMTSHVPKTYEELLHFQNCTKLYVVFERITRISLVSLTLTLEHQTGTVRSFFPNAMTVQI